jgi:predicted ATPase
MIAQRAVSDYNLCQLYHSTYFAFCRKYGTHQPKDQVLRYWNEEILQDANDDLVASWSALKTSLYEQHNAAETLVVGLFAQVCEALEGEHFLLNSWGMCVD